MWLAPDLRGVSGNFVIEIRVRNMQTVSGVREVVYQALVF